jgi:hypothetical protein
MDNIGAILIWAGNRCLIPLVAFFLGFAAAWGWLRSPISIPRDEVDLD